MQRLGYLLMEAFADSLGLKRTYFAETLCKDYSNLMLILHYPAVPKESETVQPLGEHCDYGFVTMLTCTDSGLQVKDVNNEWIDV